ncbi:MAG TPA: response regulator transcription factor [Anaerolineales bacterium]|nr:response regulator transcription factor [Anaerolineales bacterium]
MFFASFAVGYRLKDVSADELASHFPRKPRVETTYQPPTPSLDLTERERDVLALMVNGLKNTQIAGRLTVSPSTIKSHVSNILSKYGVPSRTEAVALVLRNRLVH